jgi:hypothetical protein
MRLRIDSATFGSWPSIQELIATTPSSDGTVLDDICFKPIYGKGCLIETPLDYFRSNSTVVATLDNALIQYAMDCIPIDSDSNVRKGRQGRCGA